MLDDLLTTQEAARCLGISPASLYDWLSQSNAGTLIIRGQSVTVDYLQGGPRGQGRIRIEAQEVARLKNLMRVRPAAKAPSRPRVSPQAFPGITVKLGRPND